MLTGAGRLWGDNNELVQVDELGPDSEQHGISNAINPATGKTAGLRYHYGAILTIQPLCAKIL